MILVLLGLSCCAIAWHHGIVVSAEAVKTATRRKHDEMHTNMCYRSWLIVIIRLSGRDRELCVAFPNLGFVSIEGAVYMLDRELQHRMLENLHLSGTQSLTKSISHFNQVDFFDLGLVVEIVIWHPTLEVPYEATITLERQLVLLWTNIKHVQIMSIKLDVCSRKSVRCRESK